MTTTSTYSPARRQFLLDLLTGAIENGGYGQFVVHEYEWECDEPFAVVEFEEDGKLLRYDLPAAARGLRIIRAAVPAVDPRHPNDGPVLHNAETGQRLFLSQTAQREMVVADWTNGEGNDSQDVDLDVIGYLAILECALLGAVTYG